MSATKSKMIAFNGINPVALAEAEAAGIAVVAPNEVQAPAPAKKATAKPLGEAYKKLTWFDGQITRELEIDGITVPVGTAGMALYENAENYKVLLTGTGLQGPQIVPKNAFAKPQATRAGKTEVAPSGTAKQQKNNADKKAFKADLTREKFMVYVHSMAEVLAETAEQYATTGDNTWVVEAAAQWSSLYTTVRYARENGLNLSEQ